MRLTFNPGLTLLRVSLRSASNFGTDVGTADVDRPLARDVWSGLPYVPWSAIKGVFAANAVRLMGAQGALAGPEQVFGRRQPELERPDDKPGALRFGDGELLAFPCVTTDVSPVLVYPALALHHMRLMGFAALEQPFGDLEFGGTVARPSLGHVGSHLSPKRVRVDETELLALSGRKAGGQWIVAGASAAVHLFDAAAEHRMQTALDSRKRVRAGSLRHLEFVPGGAVFISLVTNASNHVLEVELPACVQLGAWESIGAGFVHCETLSARRKERESSRIGDYDQAPAIGLASPAMVMASVFERAVAVKEMSFAAPFQRISKRLGARLAAQGVARTLAFCLAKAAPERDGPSQVQSAYRAVIAALFDLRPGESLLDHVTPVITGVRPVPTDLDARVLWLRRFTADWSIVEAEGETA